MNASEKASKKMIVAPAQTHGQADPRTRIMVVDDDIYMLELNAGVLLRAGYRVDTAEDGVIAWQMLQTARYDLLITDNQMTQMPGLELIRKLRAGGMTLPVIIASGTLPAQELEREPWLNVSALLFKPFTIDELLATVKTVLAAAVSCENSYELFRRCAVKVNQILPEKVSKAVPMTNPPNPARRILVVDDDGDTRQLSVDVLVGSGYEVVGVTDGAAGWEALQTFEYDLVMTDNTMPRMTGVEMIEKVRAARMSLPVIMATSQPPAYEFERRPWLKPDLILERPFSNGDLLMAVEKFLTV